MKIEQRLSLLLLIVLVPRLALALSVSVSVQNQVCSTPGSCYANVSGGVAPYTYLWNTSGTTPGINGLGAGVYSVTVTDANSDQATANGTVIVVDHTDQWALTGDAHCPGDGMPFPFARWSPDVVLGYAGPPPYYFNGVEVPLDPYPEQDLYNVPIESSPGVWAMPGETVQMQFMDGNGCGGTFTATAGYPVEWPVTSILQINGTCTGGSSGSVFVGYTAEGHNYSVSTEVRTMQDQIVIQGGYYWHGWGGPVTELFSGLAAGDYRLIQRLTMAEGSLYYGWCSDETIVTIPDLGTGCGNVNGTVYMDYNEDCAMGSIGSETRVPGALLEFTPGPSYATANSDGAYTIDLPDGAYTMQQIATGIAQHCPAPPVAVNVSGGIQTINVGDTALVPLDARVTMASGPARPGFELYYAIEQDNLTPATTGNTSTVMTFDPAVSFISSSPTPSNVTGNTLTWNQSALGAFQSRSIQVRFQVPPDVGLIGTVLNASVSLTTTNADALPANNSANTSVTVTGSFDPNEKVAQTSSGYSSELYYIDVDDWIDYTLRFQNTGTDTAFTVIVTDTLPATLDPSSIQWGAASHGCMRSLTGQGVLKFIFPNILLPDSNVNEPASHGFASFRIRPRLPLAPATVIENIANIFFDFNPAVITEPSVLTAEFSTGSHEHGPRQLHLLPNPAVDQLNVSASEGTIRAVAVFAADGREVMRSIMRAPNVLLDVSDFSAGPYFLIATLDNGVVVRERFIKL